jgi:hypothetical protein
MMSSASSPGSARRESQPRSAGSCGKTLRSNQRALSLSLPLTPDPLTDIAL